MLNDTIRSISRSFVPTFETEGTELRSGLIASRITVNGAGIMRAKERLNSTTGTVLRKNIRSVVW